MESVTNLMHIALIVICLFAIRNHRRHNMRAIDADDLINMLDSMEPDREGEAE